MARVHIIAAFSIAGTLLVASPASAQGRPSAEDGPAETPAETPTEAPPAPRPPRQHGKFEVSVSGAWTHGDVWNVPINLVDAQIGVGGAFAPDEAGVAFELTGTLAWLRGDTQSGRTISGGNYVGLETILHYHWFRAGVGGRLGVMGVARATENSTESGGLADGYLSIGVEPFAVDGSPFFVEAKVHAMYWGDSFTAFSVGAGFRWCNGGCPR